MVSVLKEGNKAPDFKLEGTNGSIELGDFKGKRNLVLYFYPKDNTPGCTKEACDFRDHMKEIKKHNAEVIGVSFDSLASHEKFADKFKLSFPLLSDSAKEVAQKYGVYKQKNLYGHKFMGIERSTFVIDKDLKLRKIFRKVSVSKHVNQIIDTLKEIGRP